jgi:Cys-tRNA(Pro)/Cys-tRNA(Cys) deacylase
VYDQITARLAAAGVAFRIHEHAPSITVQDAETHLDFPVEQLLKTIAFRVKNRGWVLAALCGHAQVDYKRLAAALSVSRDKLMRLTPEEVQSDLGYELGGVAPFAPHAQTEVLIDAGTLGWPLIYCGAGRNDRTLEIAPRLLVQATGARVAGIAKYYCE